MEKETEDSKFFGKNQWIYCRSHLRPHLTGWCKVKPEEKLLLNVATEERALEKCRHFGLKIYEQK